MGGTDRFSRTIPRAKVEGAATYRFTPLSGARAGGAASMQPGTDAARQAKGYEAGLARGLAEAAARAGAERAADLARLDAVLARLDEAVDGAIANAADQVLDLAIAIARQVVRDEIVARPEALVAVVREALATVSEVHGHPTVRLAPSDLELVRNALGGEMQHRGARFAADAGITPGGCRIDAPQIEIDATLETRWRRVLAALGSQAPVPRPEAPDGAA